MGMTTLSTLRQVMSGIHGHPLSTTDILMGAATPSTLKIGDKGGGAGHPISEQKISQYSIVQYNV